MQQNQGGGDKKKFQNSKYNISQDNIKIFFWSKDPKGCHSKERNSQIQRKQRRKTKEKRNFHVACEKRQGIKN